MLNILHRLWPRRKPAARITMGVHVVVVPKPIALAECEPESVVRSSGVWFGFWEDWDGGKWNWDFATCSDPWHTHWLPATVEVLPARCCPPEVERVGFAAVKQRIEAAQGKPAHAPLTASMLDELVRQMDASQPEVG